MPNRTEEDKLTHEAFLAAKARREHEEAIKKAFDTWIYMSFIIGVITEGFGLGYLIYKYVIIGG